MVTRCPLELRLKKIKAGEKWKASISYNDKRIDFDDPSVVEHLVVDGEVEEMEISMLLHLFTFNIPG